ncbi:MAG: HEAT repeat domain-containing protein, partial [Desulfosarcinaceae bacterium]
MTSSDSSALKSRKPQPPEASEGPSAAELKRAREAVAALATVAKSFTLYPKGHAMAQKQIDTLSQSLAAFFEEASTLSLEISRDGLTYRDHLLYQPQPDDDPLLPPLLRDGFLWIAFHKGVDQDQLAFFLEAVNRYRILVDEPEGDLVTELWQADLKQLRYEAIEAFWDSVPQFDFSHFCVWPEKDPADEACGVEKGPSPPDGGSETPSKGESSPSPPRHRPGAVIQIEQAPPRRELLRLSNREATELRRQVEALESEDNADTVREVLLYTLTQQERQADFIHFTSVIQDLLFDLLYHRQAAHFHDLLRGVRVLQKKASIDWQRKLLGGFITKLSGKAAWEGQTQIFRDLHSLSSAEQICIIRAVQLLAPPFIAVLAPELSFIRGSALHQNLVGAAAKLAGRNIQALEACIAGSDEATLRQIVMILGELSDERAGALLARLGRHPAGPVRETAVKTLLAKSDPPVETLLHFLNDSHAGVRGAVLDHIGRNRDAHAEAVLRDYIENDPHIEEDEDHLLACYTTLGKCGGQASMPFLEAALLHRSAGGLLRLGGNSHRLGAAMALRRCPGERAEQILKKAAKSLFPAIRNASRKALA